MGYIEPAPITDKANPFESMMSRFNIAAEALGLDDIDQLWFNPHSGEDFDY